MMCFLCTKIAIIVFYGFRLLSVFFCTDAIDHTICAAIFITVLAWCQGNAADTRELLLRSSRFHWYRFDLPSRKFIACSFPRSAQVTKLSHFHDSSVFRLLPIFPSSVSIVRHCRSHCHTVRNANSNVSFHSLPPLSFHICLSKPILCRR